MERTYRLPSESTRTPMGAGYLLFALAGAISVAFAVQAVIAVACGA